MTSDICPWLTVLELKGNKLKTLIGLDLPQLERLYLVLYLNLLRHISVCKEKFYNYFCVALKAENQLTDLSGLDGCPNITHLHARDNKISHLEDFPAIERLEYLNLRLQTIRFLKLPTMVCYM